MWLRVADLVGEGIPIRNGANPRVFHHGMADQITRENDVCCNFGILQAYLKFPSAPSHFRPESDGK